MTLNCEICKMSYNWDENNKSSAICKEGIDYPICKDCEKIWSSIPKEIRARSRWNALVNCVRLIRCQKSADKTGSKEEGK